MESDDELETVSTPLNTHRHAADESLVIGNGNLLELARKFGYTFPHEHHLTPARYFNQGLLNFSQTFASKSDYIFFAQPVLQQKT